MRIMRAVFLALFIMLCATFAAAQVDTPVTFHQQAILTASDGAAQDFLGDSAAMSGDTVVAGAPQTLGAAGKAYVFVKPASGWANMTQTAELTPSDGVPGLAFGSHVAISGDTIVVDAGASDGTGLQAVYVFVKPASGWTDMIETAKLTVPNRNFLYTVAVSGNTIAAAATEETIGSNAYQGAVYIFEKPETGWRSGLAPTARLTASDGESGDYLGFALASNASTVVATAINRAAYVFVEPAGGWVSGAQTAKLTSPNETGSDEFGDSVAIGSRTIVVGAPETGSEQEYYGAAYVYEEPTSGWGAGAQGGEIQSPNFQNEAFFGNSVGVSGSLLAIGANGENVDGIQLVGAVYVFNGTTQIAELTPSDVQAVECMGWSVAASGSTVAAGAIYATVGSNSQQGEVYVFGA